MQPEFRSQLPDQVLALVDRIESYACQEVLVKIDTRPVSETDPNPDRMAAEVTEQSATICIRSPETFSVHGAVHELLHVQRYWVEEVPQVLPLSDHAGNLAFTSNIENCLEHLVIVPREANYGLEPYEHWNKTHAALWGRHPWPDMPNKVDRRRNALLTWLGAKRLVSDPAVRQHAEEVMRIEGFSDEAEKFYERITSQMLEDKAAALATVLHYMGIKRSEVELVIFDPRARRRRTAAFPLPKKERKNPPAASA